MNQKELLQEESDDSESIISIILFRYLPYWPLFLVIFILSILSAWVYLRYATPIYETTSKILIKDEKKGLDESKIIESLDLLGSKKIVENEIEVIQSVELTSQVVRNLRLYAPITQEGRLNNVSAYLFSPVLLELANPDTLIEVKKVYFKYDPERKTVNIQNRQRPLNVWFHSDYGMMRFVPNPRYQEPTEQKPLFFSLRKVYVMANELLERIEVEPASKQSTVIYIRLNDPINQRAEDIIDNLVVQYDKAAVEDKNKLASNTIKFVEERLRYVVRELDSVENRIEKYKTSNKIVDIGEQGKQFLETVSQTDIDESKARIQLDVLNEVEKYVSGSTNKLGIVPSTFGVEDITLNQLLAKLYEAQVQYELLRKTTAENNPIVLSLSEQISRVKPQILENIVNLKKNLEIGKTNINQEKRRYAALLSAIPQKERELLQISRQQSIKNSIYSFLLQKREETALSYASTVSDSRLVDKAHSSIFPVSPKKIVIYGIAFVLGILTGVGFVSIKEVLNRNVLFRSEIESMTSAPIVGEIAHDPSKASIVVADGKRNFIAEQFRQLRTSLGYLGINSRNKKLLITSTIPNEGKSFITANLGVTLALADKKVVLIELDLRKPRLSPIFNVSSVIGITNYFIGDAEADSIIKPTLLSEKLFIIPSGPIPPNPSELILNGKLEVLLKYLETEFDYIIIDSAPVSPVTDAYIISPLCDATLYIIRHGVTPKSLIKGLGSNNKFRVLKNIALVFNGIQTGGFGKSHYGYGNAVGYDYGDEGYGSEEGKKKKSKKI